MNGICCRKLSLLDIKFFLFVCRMSVAFIYHKSVSPWLSNLSAHRYRCHNLSIRRHAHFEPCSQRIFWAWTSGTPTVWGRPPDEFARLLKAAKDDREKCLLLLLAGAGLRVGEMVAVRAEDIDFRKAYLHIRSANAKFKKARTVVLLPPVIKAAWNRSWPSASRLIPGSGSWNTLPIWRNCSYVISVVGLTVKNYIVSLNGCYVDNISNGSFIPGCIKCVGSWASCPCSIKSSRRTKFFHGPGRLKKYRCWIFYALIPKTMRSNWTTVVAARKCTLRTWIVDDDFEIRILIDGNVGCLNRIDSISTVTFKSDNWYNYNKHSEQQCATLGMHIIFH